MQCAAIKKLFPHSYHHNGFVETHALGFVRLRFMNASVVTKQLCWEIYLGYLGGYIVFMISYKKRRVARNFLGQWGFQQIRA